MPVAKDQVTELYSVLIRHVPEELLQGLFKDLVLTTAYQRNASFAETINRLESYRRQRARG